MIAAVTGRVLAIGLDHAVIDVHGVGYAVRATPSTLATLRRGDEVSLSTTLVVREDSLTLYGFPTPAAKELFELVQSVSGVGPKIALALLAVLEPDDLRRALADRDAAALMRAPGIGRKGADRLILELADKVGVLPGSGPAGAATSPAGPAGDTRLLDALVGLGFSAKQAQDALVAVADGDGTAGSSDATLAVQLRRALAVLGGPR